jgi:lipopolysaccharide transport system ATP-binding protein
MSRDVVIRAEGLGKKYLIGHHQQPERYMALRDVLARGAERLWRRTVDLAHGRMLIDGDAIEEFWALRDVDFEVKRGEVLGIIGRNGAGKSTLLKVLSRITEPSAGRVTIRGRIASLLEIGTGFHLELSGRENIYLNGAILGMTHAEIRRKFDEIVAFAEVEKFLDTPVKRYSSGMHVRLAFAVAAHLEPEILIVDEVLAVGDAEFQRRCIGKMSEVAKGGRTVLFVSHNMGAVERLCERVIWLRRGAIAGAYDDVRSGVLSYLREGDTSVRSAVWRNLGKPFDGSHLLPNLFEITSAEPGNTYTGVFSNRYPLTLTVAGDLRISEPGLNIGVAVYNEGGTLLFWTFFRDTAEVDWISVAPGPLRLSVDIPAHWLNEGDYRAELLCGGQVQWFLRPGSDVPWVTFSISGGLSDSPLWSQKRPGLMAPVLQWRAA